MARASMLLLICLFTSGCFVFDELDAGDKVLDSIAKKPAAAPAAAPAAQAPGAPGQAQAKAGDVWWANAKSLSGPPSDPGDNPAVTCAIRGAKRFMRKTDCLSQGGKIAP